METFLGLCLNVQGITSTESRYIGDLRYVEKGLEGSAILVVLTNDEETLMEYKLNGICKGS